MNRTKLTYIVLTASMLIAVGCNSDADKSDKAITKEFKLERDNKRYRVGFNHFTMPKDREHPGVPVFMETSVRNPFLGEVKGWGYQVPVGTYIIDGTMIAISPSDFGVPGYRGTQTQSCIIKNSSGTIDILFEPYRSKNWSDGIQVLEARFDGHKYRKINSDDGAIIRLINTTVNGYLPLVDSIDQAEVKQYQDFRAKYIADRNEAVVSSMRKNMLR